MLVRQDEHSSPRPFPSKISLPQGTAQLSRRNWVSLDGEPVSPRLVMASHAKAGFVSSPGLAAQERLRAQREKGHSGSESKGKETLLVGPFTPTH